MFEKSDYHHVKGHDKRDGREMRAVYNGDEFQFYAYFRSHLDFIDEVKHNENECAEIVGYYTTRAGNRFVHWYDTEVGEHYISPIDCEVTK